MPESRYVHTVNELDGKIYVVGGDIIEGTTPPTTALVYDKSSGVWTQIPLFNNNVRAAHNSCVVGGRLYVIGGTADGITTLATMDMFDPNTGQWVSKNSMPTDRGLAACASIDGKIYVMGGIRNLDYNGLKTVEVYDTNTGTWTQLTDMPTRRWGHSAVALNGKIYVFGGVTFGSSNIVYKSVEMYDPQTNSWTTKSSMPTARYCLTSCLLENKIYVIGGWNHSSNGPIYNAVEVYDPVTDEWRTEISMPVKHAALASIVLDGKIYIYGGARTTHPNYGTSGIYELSYDDIFAQQPYLNEIYARKNLDSVLFRTRFSNIYNHQFTPHLICANSDSTQMDSLTLFDDGLHGDSLANDGLYGIYIPPRQIEDYFTLSVSTIDNQNNKYYNTPDRYRFTTAGPVVLDSLEISYSSTSKNYKIKPYIRNQSTVVTIINASVKLICSDPWITSISPEIRTLPDIPSGSTKKPASSFTVNYDESLFPGYFNFEVEILSDGCTYWTDATKTVVTGIKEEDILPLSFRLEQNYPNPFNPTTSIEYRVVSTECVTLKIYDVLGNEVATLVNEEKPAGVYEVMWNAENLSSGVYFYQLKAGDFVATKKLLLLK
jgi:N-acetylneuraminic acid mutarotase